MDIIVADYNQDSNKENFLLKMSNFNFKFPNNNLGFKITRDQNDALINYVIGELRKIPTIKNKEIVYNPEFISIFYKIIWDMISKLGIATQNFYDFIDHIVSELNRITVSNYVIPDCHSTDNYNCGRAMMVINQGPSRFLIFNSDKGFIDSNTEMMYLGCDVPDLQKLDLENPSDIQLITKYYSRMTNRIFKELEILKKEFEIDIYDNNPGIKLVLKDKINKIIITFTLPLEYPLEPPSGTFNDLTISEADLDWEPRYKLKNIVDRLLYKHKNKLFPKHREILCYMLLM